MKQRLLAAFAVLIVLAGAARAEVKKSNLVTKMKNPSGVAIQPETGHVFISDSGNLRVLRYKPGEPKESRIEVSINGFPQDVYGKGPMYDIGPLGLAFLNEKKRAGHLKIAVENSVESSQTTQTQYRLGEVDFQRVVDTQRIRVQREDELADSLGQTALNLVAIYKALGGGWQTRFQPTDMLVPPEMMDELTSSINAQNRIIVSFRQKGLPE